MHRILLRRACRYPVHSPKFIPSSSRSFSVSRGASSSNPSFSPLLVASTALLAAMLLRCSADPALAEEASQTGRFFTKEEVSKKTSRENGGIYVTYKDGVYDVTKFVEIHPGGDKILLAAGKSVDPFWALYKQHYNPDVLKIMEELRVGTLSDYDASEAASATPFKNEFADEPTDRLLALPRYSEEPFNAGTIEVLIPDNYITPTPLTYVRHHHPVPRVDLDAYRLKLGWGIELSLDELKTKFPASELVVTLVCAGNRREEFNRIEPTQGLHWKSDALSTSRWKGVLLRDLRGLVVEKQEDVKHVWFVGRDDPYDASIPVDKAFSPQGDVLLAYEMNGMPIPREHGGPVRAIVPGHVAARSVKWLDRVVASSEESLSPWQRGGAYKSFGPFHKKLENVNFENYPSIQEMPVQSAICTYARDGNDALRLKGWAWSGGGRNIVRVEVSMDGGQTWEEAELGMGGDQPGGRAWAWTFWSAALALPTSSDVPELELVVRACDSSFNVQPETPNATWNLRGILNNSYHRVKFANPRSL